MRLCAAGCGSMRLVLPNACPLGRVQDSRSAAEIRFFAVSSFPSMHLA